MLKIKENERGWYDVVSAKGEALFSSRELRLCELYIRDPGQFDHGFAGLS